MNALVITGLTRDGTDPKSDYSESARIRRRPVPGAYCALFRPSIGRADWPEVSARSAVMAWLLLPLPLMRLKHRYAPLTNQSHFTRWLMQRSLARAHARNCLVNGAHPGRPSPVSFASTNVHETGQWHGMVPFPEAPFNPAFPQSVSA